MRVLVVEDDPAIAQYLKKGLGETGYRVDHLSTAEEALGAATLNEYDVLVVDLMLPGKDGNAVLQELQEDPATAGIPVIVVSAYTDSLQRTPQVRQIIAKPFDVAELLDGIERELGHRGPR